MDILRPASTSPTAATPLWRASRCSRRRPSNCGRPICAIWRLPGVLRHVLCSDDATASSAGWCRRCCARDLILCLVFMLRFSLGLGAWRFLWFSFVSLYSFRFFVFAAISCFLFLKGGSGALGREITHMGKRRAEGRLVTSPGWRERERKKNNSRSVANRRSLPSSFLPSLSPPRMGRRMA